MRRSVRQIMSSMLGLILGFGLTGTGDEMAVMNQPVRVAAPAETEFQWLQENQILPCFDLQDESYGVVVPDMEGRLRLARLPRRDAWGRATARAWIFDASLASNTVKVLVPVPLAPGHAYYPVGSRHAVVRSDAGTLELLYRFAGFEGVFSVPRATADIEAPPAPVTDPDEIMEQTLQASLESALEQQYALEEALRQAQADAVRIQTLRRDLATARVESRRLSTELLETQHGLRQVLHEDAEDDSALAERQKDLDQRLRERAAAAAGHARSQRDADALGVVEKHLEGVERDLMRVEKKAALQQAELQALRAAATDSDVRQEVEDTVRLVRMALAQQKAVSRDMAEVEAVSGRLSPWFEALTALANENEALRARLAALEAELAAARETAVQAAP